MLRWALIALGTLITLLVVIWLVGWLIPVDHSATVSRDLRAPVQIVWQRISDPTDLARWRPDIEAVDVLEPTAGALPRWRERSRTGPMTLETVRLEPMTRMVLRIADEGLPFGGTWTYTVEPSESGARLTITEDGEIYSPFFRFVARFIMGYQGTMTRYLDALEADLQAGAGG